MDIQNTIDYFEALKNDNRIKKDAIEIVHFNRVTDFKISYLESELITKRYQLPKNFQMIRGTIFVCETELAYGIGRMLQTFHEITNPKHIVIVARSESEIETIIEKIRPAASSVDRRKIF